MSDIPTAKEFAMNEHEGGSSVYKITPKIMQEKLIAFAKLHVEAALKAAKAHVEEVMEGSTFMSSDILKSYPLNNVV
jgi:hypothetical protein